MFGVTQQQQQQQYFHQTCAGKDGRGLREAWEGGVQRPVFQQVGLEYFFFVSEGCHTIPLKLHTNNDASCVCACMPCFVSYV